MNEDPKKSAVNCGCDEGALWVCDRHREEVMEACKHDVQTWQQACLEVLGWIPIN